MMILIFANMLLASTFSIGKVLIKYIDPTYLIGIRMLVSGLLLLCFQFFWDRQHFYIRWRFVSSLIQLAFFNLFLSYVIEFWAFEYVSSIKVTLIYNLSIFVTPLYAFFFFGQRMTLKKWLGLIIGICGVIPVLFSSAPQEEVVQAFGSLSWPEICLIFGVFAYCYGWVHTKKLILQQYPPFMINGIAMFLAGIMTLLSAQFFSTWQPITNMTTVIGLMSALIIIGNLLCSNLYTILFKYYTISLVAFGSLMVPLFAAFFGYFFLDEKITHDMFISLLVVGVGLYIFYQEELRQGYQ